MKKRIRINLVLMLLALVTACSAFVVPAAAADVFFDDGDYQAAILNAAEPADAEGLKFSARATLLMDAAGGTVLFEKNSEEKLPIASMTKIMTLLLTFEAIDKGTISPDSETIISPEAAGMGGSQAFLDANAAYKIRDLIKSCVIASANDSSVALAELIAGSETAFVSMMNDKAQELNMTNTNFVNCTGLPVPNHFSCARDVALMMRALLKHTAYFEYSTIWMEDMVHPGGRVTGLTNTNKLSRFYNGCDGGKTGFTAEAKHCISATAKRGGLRLISVIIAAPDSKTRFAECSSLLNFGFGAFESKTVLSKDKAIDTSVKVTRGKAEKLAVVANEDFAVLSKKGAAREEATFEYNLPESVSAPVKAGDKIGSVKIFVGGELKGECDLFAKDSVAKTSFLDILKKFVK